MQAVTETAPQSDINLFSLHNIYPLPTRKRIANQVKHLSDLFTTETPQTNIEISNIIETLISVQSALGTCTKLHLIVEWENDNIERQSSEGFSHYRFRPLFSPTISADTQPGIEATRLLVQSLTRFSIISKSGNSAEPNEPQEVQQTPRQQNEVLPSLASVPDNINHERQRRGTRSTSDCNVTSPDDIPTHVTTLKPSWFPTTSPLDDSTFRSTSLTVSSQPYFAFKRLPLRSVLWIYSTTFRLLHKYFKPTCPHLSKSLIYGEFTPPWLRHSILVIGEDPIYIQNAQLPDLRNERTKMGHKRISLLLAAFKEREAEFAGNLITWLSTHVRLPQDGSRLTPRRRAREDFSEIPHEHINMAQIPNNSMESDDDDVVVHNSDIIE